MVVGLVDGNYHCIGCHRCNNTINRIFGISSKDKQNTGLYASFSYNPDKRRDEHGKLSKEHCDILNQANNIQTSISNIHMSVNQIKEITIGEKSKAKIRYKTLSESDKNLHDFVDKGVNSIKDFLYKYQIAVATIEELRFENKHLKTKLQSDKQNIFIKIK